MICLSYAANNDSSVICRNKQSLNINEPPASNPGSTKYGIRVAVKVYNVGCMKLPKVIDTQIKKSKIHGAKLLWEVRFSLPFKVTPPNHVKPKITLG